MLVGGLGLSLLVFGEVGGRHWNQRRVAQVKKVYHDL